MLEASIPDDNSDGLGETREMHGGLTRRIAAADNNPLLVRAKRSLAGAGAIEYARPGQALLIREIQAIVLDTSGAHRRTGDDSGSIGEGDDRLPVVELA